MYLKTISQVMVQWFLEMHTFCIFNKYVSIVIFHDQIWNEKYIQIRTRLVSQFLV